MKSKSFLEAVATTYHTYVLATPNCDGVPFLYTDDIFVTKKAAQKALTSLGIKTCCDMPIEIWRLSDVIETLTKLS